ncbi:MAG: AbrB/MazE/SpoVT family DNA-binding domain-containing protein [Patescibacteria group bacterium]|jgi:AbrB family looped-hinge helix DNA binding protein
MKNLDKFFGSTTIGKKGQVVIPMETRKKMLWKEGDKLLVFGLENGVVAITKLGKLKEFASHLEKKMNKVKQYIKKAI